MRPLFALLLLPVFAFSQTADEKKATLKFIDSLRDPDTGAWAVSPPKDGEKLKPSLRAVNGAVNALKFFGGELTDKEKVQKFVMGCFDEKTGAFAEPGDKSSVTMTSVGVLAATSLGIDKAKYKKAMAFIDENAKAFDELRLGAAAVEAFGAKECEVDIDKLFARGWKAWVDEQAEKEANARALASLSAFKERLGPTLQVPYGPDALLARPVVRTLLPAEQRADGGWGKKEAKTSDAETTYRVMRALVLLKEKPKDADGVAKFVASCRRKDGGYGVDAEAASNMSGVYYAAKISEWNK